MLPLFGELLQVRHIVQGMEDVQHRAIGEAHLYDHAIIGELAGFRADVERPPPQATAGVGNFGTYS